MYLLRFIRGQRECVFRHLNGHLQNIKGRKPKITIGKTYFNNQLNVQFLYSITICMLHYNPLHVSSINMPIFRRTNCIITASGIVALCKGLYSMPDESSLLCSGITIGKWFWQPRLMPQLRMHREKLIFCLWWLNSFRHQMVNNSQGCHVMILGCYIETLFESHKSKTAYQIQRVFRVFKKKGEFPYTNSYCWMWTPKQGKLGRPEM